MNPRAWSIDTEETLHLTYTNPAFTEIFGRNASDDFIHVLHYRSRIERFKQWILQDEPTMSLEILAVDGKPFPVELTKTHLSADAWVFISIPRALRRTSDSSQPHAKIPSPPPDRKPSSNLPGSSTVTRVAPNSQPRLLRNPPIKDSPILVADLMDTFDWSTTSLGPRERWPQSLKSALSMVLSAAFPTCLFWGPDSTSIYNEAYRAQIAGSKHPRIWGQPLSIAWEETYKAVEPDVIAVKSGTPVFKYDDQLFLDRLTDAGLLQEYYLTWSYTPIRQEDGSVGGFTCLAFDSTEKVLAQRRMGLLRDVITTSITATSPSEFSQTVLGALSKEEYSFDVSFAAFYFCSVDSTALAQGSPSPDNVTLKLDGSFGIPANHPTTPPTVSIQFDISEAFLNPIKTKISTDSTCPWPFLQAIQSHHVIHVTHLPESVTLGYERRGWKDQPREAVVIPIGFADEVIPVPSAVLIVGLNTRRPYDATYVGDTNILGMTLSSTLHAMLSREAEMKRAKRLAEIDAAKTVFFSNVSHELRTPLTLIDGPLEDCITKVTDGPVKQQLKMARRNVYRLRRLVDSLMDFSKLAANRLEGHFRPVRLGEFTADLASLFRSSVERGGLKYNVECDSDTAQPICYIDPDFWEKIVFNLVGNALKFTLEGSIIVSVTHTSNSAVFVVKDTGAGIPPDDISRIFQRFYRAQTTSRSHEGTGIGLSLTKELVTLHGGDIRVESMNDPSGAHGSAFIVTIPLGKDHLPKANVYEDDSAPACRRVYARGVIEEASLWTARSPLLSGEDGILDEPGMLAVNPTKGLLDPSAMFFSRTDIVLLADDNADIRQYVKSILSRYCTVVEASNGQDALDIAIKYRPNIILSDVMMSGLDGFTLLNELRARSETSLIPIILVTARSGEDSRVEGLLSGADDYLTKPFKSTELIARVHLQMQLGKRRLDMEAKFSERTFELQQLSEMSPVAIFRADKAGSVTYVNPRWYDITGCLRDGSANAKWPENVHPEDKNIICSWWEKAQISNASCSPPTTIDFRWKNGNWCQGQYVVLENRGTLGVFTDISKQKELEACHLLHAQEKAATARREAEEAEESRKEAEERRRGQELLIDVTSHELRQPVSAILNCSSLIRLNLSKLHDEVTTCSGTLKATPELVQSIKEDLDALDAIYQCGLVQERIANDVLCLSRLQLDVLSIHPVDFNLEKEVSRIIALFRNEAYMKQIDLSVRFGQAMQRFGIPIVSADRARFSQILTNLLSNAVKFTDTSLDKRDICVEVDIGFEPPRPDSCQAPHPDPTPLADNTPTHSRLFIYVSVTDSGPGLDPGDLSRLFQRFQQGSHSHDVFGGSGLGLFVSRQLCSLMGGQIEVSSTPGQGATFRFFIEATSGSSTAPMVSLHDAVLPSIINPSQPMHVLITEDNLINQAILNRQLKRAGCTTVLASNGRQAIQELCSSTKAFDAILMDVEMPVLDGLSAVRKIRVMEATGELPHRHRVIALTGNAREGQVQNIRQAGMDDVMIKPYRIDEILTRIRNSA